MGMNIHKIKIEVYNSNILKKKWLWIR